MTENTEDLLTVRTKTGKEVHLGLPGFSTTVCGVWLKVDNSRMAVRHPATCERCLSLKESRNY